ncbi:MAG: HEPN domain-containing protein [Syntrophaceae bacterium]
MDNKIRELIKVRLEKTEEDIDTAVELLSFKRYRAAVNRAYYALFSITTAVLLTKNLERSKHTGVEAAFNQHFIKTGIFEIEYGKIFNYVRQKREESDYTAKVMIDKETAERIVEDSKRFIQRMKKYLTTTNGT